MRLIDHLRESGLSNRQAKAALTSGKVFVKDAPTADATRDVEPADVTVRHSAPKLRPWVDVAIVYRDDELAVVAKPPRMLSVPAANRRNETSVLSEVRRQLGKALPVHRLDEGTSGLMLVARTERCQVALKDMLFVHDIERRYLALVAGEFPSEPITRETTIVRDRGDGLRGSKEGDGKRACGHFRLHAAFGVRRSVVSATLETGRTHQIRIHLSELGYPILGDRIYAARNVASASPRLALHSTSLQFTHPIADRRMHFEALMADDLARLMRQ